MAGILPFCSALALYMNSTEQRADVCANHIRKEPHDAELIEALDLIRDPSLSWAARGLHIFLLSLPNGSAISEAQLIEQSTKGRDHLRAVVHELIRAGYLAKQQPRTDAGRMAATEWIVRIAPSAQEVA